MKTRDNRPLREHFEVSTDNGEALRTFDYIEELEAYINYLEALRQPAVISSLPPSEFEFDDENEDDHEQRQCDICGLTDDHSIDCPHDNSPFANLIREGFD